MPASDPDLIRLLVRLSSLRANCVKIKKAKTHDIALQ